MSAACCEKFAEASGAVLSTSPFGGMYPSSVRPEAQIEFNEGWHVAGCCGGGCYVLTDLKFCPWCSAPLPEAVSTCTT